MDSQRVESLRKKASVPRPLPPLQTPELATAYRAYIGFSRAGTFKKLRFFCRWNKLVFWVLSEHYKNPILTKFSALFLDTVLKVLTEKCRIFWRMLLLKISFYWRRGQYRKTLEMVGRKWMSYSNNKGRPLG